MSCNLSRFNSRLLPAVVGVGLAVGTIGAATHAEAGPLRCELQVSGQGSAVSLEAVVLSSTRADGTYQLHVSGPGSDIAQSGEFSVAAGGKSSLSSVTLAGDGAYTARLSVTSSAGSSRCTKRL